jgi:hypothetical protein
MKAAAPARNSHPSLARRPASPAAARRRGASGVPPRLDGRGIHKRGAAVVLTSVATGRSAVRRCSVAVRLADEEEEEEGGGVSSGK